MEELLREAASLGNLDGVQKLLQSGTNINSQNGMNGWTALHWASKRGHSAVVHWLLHSGADANIKSHNGELPLHVATAPDVIKLLEEGGSIPVSKATAAKLPITPHYLENPPFPYYDISIEQEKVLRVNKELASVTGPNHINTTSAPVDSTLSGKMASLVISGTDDDSEPSATSRDVGTEVTTTQTLNQQSMSFENGSMSQQAESPGVVSSNHSASIPSHPSLPLLVKVRVAGSGESDFVEVEVPSLSYQALLRACCEELEVGTSDVVRLRKLPNIWVRKDRDIQRMREGQELEVVLKNEPFSLSP